MDDETQVLDLAAKYIDKCDMAMFYTGEALTVLRQSLLDAMGSRPPSDLYGGVAFALELITAHLGRLSEEASGVTSAIDRRKQEVSNDKS